MLPLLLPLSERTRYDHVRFYTNVNNYILEAGLQAYHVVR